jgi:hypothetical protein
MNSVLSIFRRTKATETTNTAESPKDTEKEKTMSEFPSPDFVQRADSAAQRLENAKREVETLQEQLAKFRRNREALEISGKNPDDEISRTRDEMARAELEVNRAKEATHSLFLEERERFAPARQDLWENLYLPIVTTAAGQFTAAVVTLQRMSRELAALEEPPIAGSASISALDADASAHNALVAKFRMPSNMAINPRDSLAAPFEHAVRQMLAKSNLVAALKELHRCLGLEDQPQGIFVDKLASRLRSVPNEFSK